MTMIRHHLPDALLMGYAAGTLPEAFNLVVATHVSLSDEARARLGAFEAVGGSVIDDADAAEMASGSLDRMMARLDMLPQANARAPLAGDAIYPAPLLDYMTRGLKWQSVGRGVKQAILKTDGAASARLIRIPGGQAMPDHGHKGTELTLVLQGAFMDGNRRYARGDVDVATEETEHTPMAEAGVECICLAASDAPLKFHGLLPRLAQPFFKI
ncbi:MAG: ChrR family anti-sigma-E factor [Rhodobacteraceae bacterium]|jgi:putative transcriptional regulator|nr:ChrR family anti-sigma-E factor [Paracoccaceae bacterium]